VEGKVAVPNSPGLGVDVNPHLLQQMSVLTPS